MKRTQPWFLKARADMCEWGLSIADVCEYFGFSRTYLHRITHNECGTEAQKQKILNGIEELIERKRNEAGDE